MPLTLIMTREDVTTEVLDLVAECVQDRFASGVGPVDEFIDCLCDRYGNPAGWDIEDMGSPAVAKITKWARRYRNEIA